MDSNIIIDFIIKDLLIKQAIEIIKNFTKIELGIINYIIIIVCMKVVRINFMIINNSIIIIKIITIASYFIVNRIFLNF